MRGPQNDWTISQTRMAQLEDAVGAAMKKLALASNTIVAFSKVIQTEKTLSTRPPAWK